MQDTLENDAYSEHELKINQWTDSRRRVIRSLSVCVCVCVCVFIWVMRGGPGSKKNFGVLFSLCRCRPLQRNHLGFQRGGQKRVAQ
jgi:hypothetical protein